MYAQLLHIYGPLYLNSYGLAIAVGLCAFTWLVTKNPRFKAITTYNQFINTVVYATVMGIIGGRLLFLITNWHTVEQFTDIIALWDGGFSLLGTVITLLIALPWYLKKHAIPIVPFFDLIAIYAPLLQSISRIGCFLAGCCYGTYCTLPWAVTYCDTASRAPLHIPLHPTQLYSAITLFCIFLLFYFVLQHSIKTKGQLLLYYLFFIGWERLMVGFLRADKQIIAYPGLKELSVDQWLALLIAFSAYIGLHILRIKHRTHEPV